MIVGLRTTPLGKEVVDSYVGDGTHQLLKKVAQRDVVVMATCLRADFTSWPSVMAQLPKAEPRQLTAVALKLEKLGLVQLERPVVKPQAGNRSQFGFDKNGEHRWV